MKKKIFSIWSVLLVLVVSIAIVVPGCDGDGDGDGQCTIEVYATLCDVSWQGSVNYKLIPESGSPIDGTKIPDSFTVDCGNWTGEYVSGGPDNAYLVDILLHQTDSKITVTLNFELEQDAWIDIPPLPWTVKGVPIQGGPEYYEYYDGMPCDIIDVHFLQGVYGCEEYQAAVNETSWLMIHLIDYWDWLVMDYIEPPGPVLLYAVNDWCAVNKTVEEPPPGPPEKVSQYTTWEEKYINPGDEPIEIIPCFETWVDVETIWTLVKEVEYLKSINWFGIWVDEYVPDLHPCVLFELVVPSSLGVGGIYHFQLQASAQLELMDDEDIEEGNNFVWTPPLDLYVNVP